MASVKAHGRSLSFTWDAFKNDREIILAAVQQNCLAIRYVSVELQSDYELRAIAGWPQL